MKLIIIAAIGKNNELGLNNDLIWHIKEDLQFFKNATMNHKIVMGKNTLLSLPKKLKGREYIVISKTTQTNEYEVYRSIEDFISAYSEIDEKIFCIGGSSIYREMIKYADEMYITHINEESKADVYFPEIDNSFTNEETKEYNENGISYTRTLYKRNK